MKSFFVRLSVLALATTGFAASTVVAKAPVKHLENPAVISMGTGPVATCWPGNNCGKQVD